LILILVALVLIATAGVVAWFYLRGRGEDDTQNVIVRRVIRGPYEHVVLEQGQVESAESVEIRCEVESRSGAGTEILWVIEEGTHVKQGDKLIELESSGFEQELVQQQIVCNTSQAAVIQAENTLAAAEIAKLEYLEGAFRQEEQAILSEIFVAEENLRRAQLAFQSTERLAAKGIVTSLQLEGDEYAVEKAKNELDAAETKLEVIRKYTKPKMLKQFESDIATSSAQWESEKESYKLEMEKLADIKKQIANCQIYSPQDGQVVYANVYSSRGGSAQFVVEEGAAVRERQVLIRLPERDRMQIKATINESRISLVREGMPVEITLDAVKDRMLAGSVTKVNQYAEPGSWTSGNIKEYAALISIHNPPPEIRTGMNAEVRIFVERRADALQVPVQTLYETKNHYFCLIKNGSQFETREVQVGSSNDSFMTIESGLEEGEVVVMNPRAYPDKLEIPDLPDPEPEDAPEGFGAEVAGPPDGDAEGFGGPDGPPAGPRRKPGGGGPADADSAGAPDRADRPRGEGGGGPGGGPGGGGLDPMQMFARRDANGDGTVTADELADVPAQYRDRLLQNDTDGDGAVSRDEFTQGMANGQGGRPPQGSGGGGE
jgi:multidrug efflux pump subunit AcrA (membrane-fusion protein)